MKKYTKDLMHLYNLPSNSCQLSPWWGFRSAPVMEQGSSQVHPAHAPQFVLWDDSRQTKRKASGFTTKAGNFHHFKTPGLFSIFNIGWGTYLWASKLGSWLNSRVFLLNLFACFISFWKARSSHNEIPYANSLPGTSPPCPHEYSKKIKIWSYTCVPTQSTLSCG